MEVYLKTLEVKQLDNRKRQKDVYTTLNLRVSTKKRINKDRAPGQCYDGFICQLIDSWENIKENKKDYAININKGR